MNKNQQIQTLLRNNLAIVQSRIEQSAFRAGRKAEDITLIVVTKTVSSEIIEFLANLNVQHLGENRVQIANEKKQRLSNIPFRWHLIGHLQTNKVKQALNMFHTIHSVDSVHLATEISHRAISPTPILLEVNTGKEENKDGFSAQELERSMENLLQLPNLNIQGLMTMAPFTTDSTTIRSCFSGLRELGQKLNDQYKGNLFLQHLSMGMSNDYEIAVEEGATMLRVGSAIFEGLEQFLGKEA